MRCIAQGFFRSWVEKQQVTDFESDQQSTIVGSRFPVLFQRQVTLFLAVCVVDLGSKWLAFQVGIYRPLVTPGLNRDLALGIVSTSAPRAALVGLTLAAIALLVHSALLSRATAVSWLILPLVAGGAVANASDRLATGAVHDWLNLGVAVANIADFALLAGLMLYVRISWTEHS